MHSIHVSVFRMTGNPGTATELWSTVVNVSPFHGEPLMVAAFQAGIAFAVANPTEAGSNPHELILHVAGTQWARFWPQGNWGF